MFIKQLSVFIEKKKGRLSKVAEVLKENKINIVSLSIADASEYSILRMIVSDPLKGEIKLKEEGFTSRLADVLSVKTAQEPGALFNIIQVLEENNLQLEYIYPLSTSKEKPCMIIKVQDGERGLRILQENKYKFSTEKEAYGI